MTYNFGVRLLVAGALIFVGIVGIFLLPIVCLMGAILTLVPGIPVRVNGRLY